MSTQITCFNGKECTYSNGCVFYKGDPDTGGCILETVKNAPVQPTESRSSSPKQTTIEGETKIGDLNVGDKSSKGNEINIRGTLVYDPTQRDVDTNSGPRTVANALIEDDTGQLRLSFWGKGANEIMNYEKGDKLAIGNIYKIKEPYDGTLQAEAGKFFKIAKVN